MNRLLTAFALSIAVVLATASPARAEETVLGSVTRIEVARDGKSAVATIKDKRTAAAVAVTVVDEVTLKKFGDHRIGVGDEIKCRYEKKGDKNVATFFKKPGGC